MNNYTNPVTVTGNPASFEASGSGKLLSLSVPFSPIQDLHGYSSPWPAGGGKNLFAVNTSATSSDVIASASDTTGVIGVADISTAKWALPYIGYTDVVAGKTYTISGGPLTYGRIGGSTASNAQPGASTIPDVDIGSTIQSAVTNLTGSRTFTANSTQRIYWYYCTDAGNSNHRAFEIQPVVVEGSSVGTWSPYSNICPISGRTGLSVYVSPTQNIADATTYAVDWTTEAGTVYGGTLDVVTGLLTVDKKYFTQSGDVLLYGNWGYDNAPLYYFLIDTTIPIKVYADTQDDGYILSNYFSATTGFGPESMKNNEIRTRDSTPDRLYFRWDSAGSLADINAAFAENPLQIVAELATPLTYQLTPTQVALILGQNYVWSDSNEAVTLTYIIELFTRYTFIVNGNDYTGLVERDSYRTAVMPVYGETIQTLDGVGHTALLRVKGSLTVKLNPQTAAQTAALCADLLNAPCEVQYKCLQRNVNVTALMVLDAVSAMFLSRCMYLGQKWNDVDEIVLKEL